MEKKRNPSFWVEGGGGDDLKITHLKCGKEVEIREVPYGDVDDPKFFQVLDCKNKEKINCLASGGLYFFDDALEKFKADLKNLQPGEQILVRRGPVVEAPERSYMLSSQVLEVFEKR
jgi:hypothetical protein